MGMILKYDVVLDFEKLKKEELIEIIVAASAELKNRSCSNEETLPRVLNPGIREDWNVIKPDEKKKRKKRTSKEEMKQIDEFIKHNYTNMSIKAMAKELNIPYKTVYKHKNNMGLKKGGYKLNPAAEKAQKLKTALEEQIEHDKREQGL